MVISKKLDKYIIALPDVDLGIPEYNHIKKLAGTMASSPANAIGNYLHRIFSRTTANLVMAQIRDDLGGYECYALRVPSGLSYDEDSPISPNSPMDPRDARMAEEIEVSLFLAEFFGGDEQEYLESSRDLLDSFTEKLRRRKPR